MKTNGYNCCLMRRQSTREGFTDYWDFFLVWRHDNKVCSTRIRQCFGHEMRFLFVQAVEVPQGEPFEKYF